ncbi:Sugar phosphate permease [Bryocella elongata]|uniref:Sugar phosphate permease n=1 Tax=Bryocella elongata TaxID=863522 RepID=A0A1H5XYP0_9BACT|nr:MFS transporter [Bryocella elongata]SEG16752.1 Sugar phosphate permease [Bryocella elongata]
MATVTSPRYKVAPRTALALLLLVFAGCLNYVDRVSLSIAHGPVKTMLGVSETRMGGLMSIFSIAYGLAQLPVGPLSDRFGTRRVLGAGLTLWSFAQLLVARVHSLFGFMGLRVILGVGEAPYYPASIQLIHSELAASLRARALALVNSSAMVGQAIAPPLLTVIMLHYGWRPMFAITGAVGLVLSLIWFLLLRDRSGSPPVEDGYVAPRATPLSLGQWARFFSDPVIWLMMSGFAGVNYTAWFYIAWLPSYLENGRGISVAHTGWLAALPYLAATVGMHTDGWLADRLVRGGAPAPRVHVTFAMGGLFASAVMTLLVPHVRSHVDAIALIMIAMFFLQFAGNSAWGYAQSVSPQPIVATVSSIQNFGSQVFGSLAPLLTGAILDYTHSFNAAFGLCGCITAMGGLCYLYLWRTRVVAVHTPRA